MTPRKPLNKCADCGIPIKNGPVRCKPCSHDHKTKIDRERYNVTAAAKVAARAPGFAIARDVKKATLDDCFWDPKNAP